MRMTKSGARRAIHAVGALRSTRMASAARSGTPPSHHPLRTVRRRVRNDMTDAREVVLQGRNAPPLLPD